MERQTIRQYLAADPDPRLQQLLRRLGRLADTPVPADYGYRNTARWLDQLIDRADRERGGAGGRGWAPAVRRPRLRPS
jgi:hypothetical protein